MSVPSIAIGGYFAIERGLGAGLSWIDEAIGYRSARSALASIFAVNRPAAVWVPNFICSAVTDALRSRDIDIRRYALSKSLGLTEQTTLAQDELLLCVDYFGINAAEIDRAIARFGHDRVIVDASQALFHSHRTGCTTIYSPRKFLGVPDGGLLRTARMLGERIDPVEADSIARSQHLLYRLSGEIDTGYRNFHEAEASLAGCQSIAMSRLTDAILRSTDIDKVASLRVRNYHYLSELLRMSGMQVQDLPANAVPLCCPVRCHDAAKLRLRLVTQGIFTPTYWPDAIIPADDRVALSMRDQTVYLPCDQRYGEPELDYVAKTMIDSTGAS